ncbi:MAG TPA: glycosyltransferase family 39 protein, partial [Pyrinomonadaceae bacterium]|nr:glycosyltransferase family 39 protein [Pyrinomonadaceae bacterium]
MNALLTLLSLILCAFIVLAVPTLVVPYSGIYGVVTAFDTSKAVLLCTAIALLIGLFSYRQKPHGSFLLKLFISALLIRMLLATIIFVFNKQDFFGGDAMTYDFFGETLLRGWRGDRYYLSVANRYIGVGQGTGWGMIYLVAGVYGLIGRNMLAVQFINGVLGAAAAVVIFLCAHHVFNNLKVARLAAIAVAFYPSLVLWSSQGLKDGPIVFFLALSILATLKLGRKLTVNWLAVLVCSLFVLLSLRFYIFYMIFVAIAGAFIIGAQPFNARTFIRQTVVIIAVGLALT